ncbi:MAG: hypothetical protein JSV84_04720, partial [Gemmatimonadota bacterium]
MVKRVSFLATILSLVFAVALMAKAEKKTELLRISETKSDALRPETISHQKPEEILQDGCEWLSYWCDPYYYWMTPNPSWGDSAYAMRFTVAEPRFLMGANVYIYNPGDGTFGNDDVHISVYDDDGTGLPGAQLAQVILTAGTYPAYPTPAYADFSPLNLIVNGDFHIAFSSSGEVGVDYESIVSDDGSCGTLRSTDWWVGYWALMLDYWDIDVNFLIDVYLGCEEPCDDCGPGSHWIDVCAAGTDFMGSGALVTIDLDLDPFCEPDAILELSGPVVVNRTGPLDDSVIFPGTRPIDGHLDVIDTEIISMSLSGGGVTLTAGAGHGQGGVLAPSLGTAAEMPADPFWVESFFDVFFEVDLGGGMYAYNHTPLRVNSEIDCVPPGADFTSPIVCLPLYNSPSPGQGEIVAQIVWVDHFTFPEPPEACCLPDGSCTDIDPGVCVTLGGTPQGPGTVCTAPEGCCFPDGSCSDLDPLCCVDQGGNPQGPGSQCGGMEVCCLPDGSCTMADALCCINELSGFPQGPGTVCTAPEGCCLPDGSCSDLDPLCCVDQGGTPQGPGTVCTVPEGCCFPDGSCSDLDPLCC